MADWDDFDDERDFYSDYEELLDDDRMPVIVNLGRGEVYAVSYEITDWSPLRDPDADHERLATDAIIATAYEAHGKGLYGTDG